MAAVVDKEKCTGCGSCVEACPVDAIKVENDKAVIDNDECIDCGTCVDECPEEAISLD
jgi:Fe-S-cluster-containing hydrogenase component 2